VFAVGDTQFQKKCLGKMKDLSRGGRTVLFVSHFMTAIEQMCNKCILLDSGRILKFDDNVKNVIHSYIVSNTDGIKSCEWISSSDQYKNKWFSPKKITLIDEFSNELKMPVSNNNDIYIKIEGEVFEENEKLVICYFIYNEENILIYQSASHDTPISELIQYKKGNRIITTKIPKRFLNEGEYRIEFQVFLHGEKIINYKGNKPLTIYLTIEEGLSDSIRFLHRRQGILAPILDWNIK
jgi:lipopolysaccharide transport system ATP-binding protein